MQRFVILLLSVCFTTQILAQEDLTITPLVKGTLLVHDTPDNIKTPLVILIAGSGPIDRDGNQAMSKSNSLKFLAEGLLDQGISSFRYDKRLVQIMKSGQIDERKISFDDFITDAQAVVDHFKKDERFRKIVVVGHSQGSLVGMIAAANGADGFISLAGAGQEIDDVIVDQLTKQAPGLTENARKSFDDIRVNGVAQNYSPGLASIFRPALQPFLYSWMKYDPAQEIAKLEIPILIVNGDKDLQVSIDEAELLKAAQPNARLEVITNMNHIMKEIAGGDMDNYKSCNQPDIPVMPDLISLIASFVMQP